MRIEESVVDHSVASRYYNYSREERRREEGQAWGREREDGGDIRDPVSIVVHCGKRGEGEGGIEVDTFAILILSIFYNKRSSVLHSTN